MSADNWGTCPQCKADGTTLREDYETGIDEDGEFYFYYSGGCECGFKFLKRINEKVPVESTKGGK